MADRMNVTHEYDFQYVVYRKDEGPWGLRVFDNGTWMSVITLTENGAVWEKTNEFS